MFVQEKDNYIYIKGNVSGLMNMFKFVILLVIKN